MDLATNPTAATVIPLRPPHATRPGLPARFSVLVTDAPRGNRFPDTGYGVGSWMQPLGRSLDQAVDAAHDLSLSFGPLALVRLRRFSSVTSYGAAPLTYLNWEPSGYGGHFTESAVMPGQIGPERLYAFQGKGAAPVVAIVDGARLITPAQRW